MTTDITELAQRMKAAAEKATKGQWVAFTDTATKTFAVHTPNDKRCENIIKWAGFDCQKNAGANAEFIALANPVNTLALVEALEKAQQERENWHTSFDNERFRADKLKAHIDEMTEERTGSINELSRIIQREIKAKREAEKRIAELERSETQLIDERDAAESALADMYEAGTGERPEWSNAFGFCDAVDEVRENVDSWIRRAEAAEKRIAELEARIITVKFEPIPMEELGNRGDGKKHPYMFGAGYNSAVVHCESVLHQACAAAGIGKGE